MALRAELRTPFATAGHVHRVGKVRAGVKKQGSKEGKAFEYPSAVDYFVVNADAATSQQSADSFHAVYGPEPRELRITLPAERPEDVLVSLWRMYGGGQLLKRKCEGPGLTCDERDKGGGWVRKPCACTAEGADPDDKTRHCQPRWTLNFLLMDVVGVGVWQFDTGSPMAGNGMEKMLMLLHDLRGSLLRAECLLRLVPQQVAPKGTPKTVYIGRIEVAGLTPQQALEAATGAPIGIMPPSTLDDGPDDLLDVVEIPQLVRDAVARVPEREAAPTMGRADAGPGKRADAGPGKLPTPALQLKALSLQERADLYQLAGIAKGSKSDVVYPLLCSAWDTVGLAPFTDELDVRTLLTALRAYSRSIAREDGVDEFQRFAESGEDTPPGDQTTIAGEPGMYGEGAPS